MRRGGDAALWPVCLEESPEFYSKHHRDQACCHMPVIYHSGSEGSAVLSYTASLGLARLRETRSEKSNSSTVFGGPQYKCHCLRGTEQMCMESAQFDEVYHNIEAICLIPQRLCCQCSPDRHFSTEEPYSLFTLKPPPLLPFLACSHSYQVPHFR